MRRGHRTGLGGAALAAVVVGFLAVGRAAEPDAKTAALEKQRAPKPAEFASVFSFGYAGDHMPKDDARFEALLEKIKPAGFNTIHCVCTDGRLALCKKHGVRMMVDLLAGKHHVYKSVEGARALCRTLRGRGEVWGYNLWNDSISKTSAGRKRDVNNVRRWDPTHPAFVGTYRTYGMRGVTNADVIGYYDYHWKRGPKVHFPHLLTYRRWAPERDACFYRWVATDSGRPGLGNFNRSLYTANTSIACGLKGILWFIGTRMMDPKTLWWTTIGGDIIKVNREIMPLRTEIMKIGAPTAVYSTPIAKTLKDRALPDGKASMMPPGLENSAFPADFRIQPAGGEFVMGVFRAGPKRDAIFVANHNAYAEQAVTLTLRQPAKVSVFGRKEGTWRPVTVAGNTVTFPLAPAGGELLRLEGAEGR